MGSTLTISNPDGGAGAGGYRPTVIKGGPGEEGNGGVVEEEGGPRLRTSSNVNKDEGRGIRGTKETSDSILLSDRAFRPLPYLPQYEGGANEDAFSGNIEPVTFDEGMNDECCVVSAKYLQG